MQLEQEGIIDQDTQKIVAAIPREAFVPESQYAYSYERHPLPIGYDQTISEISLVAEMTMQLYNHCNTHDRVLEIGTGSGYQAALLAQRFTVVYTVERIAPLLERAQKTFNTLQYTNIHTALADGQWGWPEPTEPFDGIIVTCAIPEVPDTLKQQCAIGGVILAPVGEPNHIQTLRLLKRTGADEWQVKDLSRVRFVPVRNGIVPND